MKRTLILNLALLSCLVSLPNLLHAQEVASLTGVVADKTGAVIPDVNVKLVDTRTNASYETKTDAVGAYNFTKVPPGPGYKVTFTKDGFETFAVANIYLAVGSTHTQNIQLEIGKVTQVVEVNVQGTAVSLDTTDAVVGSTFDMSRVHELPIEARESPAALLALLPGVVDTSSSNDSNGSRAGAVTGARTDQTNVTLDGLDVNDFATGQAFATVGDAPVDSIQEFGAQTANPLSASGRGSGGEVQLVTKSGTNQWHGSAFDYLRNTVTEANTFFNNLDGIPKPKLIRNSFGANLGGPIVKDKLFFFFNYQGRRDAREDSVLHIVPLDSFRNGSVSYINDGPGCTNTSRINTQPDCITTLSTDQIRAQNLDPGADPNTGLPGPDSALLSFINSRYPHANDLTVGDGVNTGGFRFNSPVSRSINDYVARIDYNLASNMKLFGRFSILRDFGGDDSNFQAPIQFPGDPLTNEIADTSYAYVIGHTWTISPNKVNQFYYGETRSQLNFPVLFKPTAPDFFQGFGPISAPYANFDAQHRIIPVPVYRDDFTYVRGTHNIQFGGTFKPIRTQSSQVFDYNLISMGLGGNLSSLSSSQEPSDILQDPIAQDIWDSSFALSLGRVADISTNVNYNSNLQPLPLGTGHTRNYRYFETEIYLQDSWHARSDLTLSYGLRWQYYSVPYEINGLEAVPSIGFDQVFGQRVQEGLQGVLGPQPITSYLLGGRANHGPGLYNPDWKDFSPRLSFAYNPSSSKGFFGRMLGERKTVLRAGAGLIFDHPTTNALNFIQDQASYLFQTNVPSRPPGDLATDCRYPISNCTINPAPPGTSPVQPFVDPTDGPFGAAAGASNYAVDPNLKAPYAITFTAGIQRELPGNFLFETNYFGRLGRRLMAQADAAQIVDFQDTTSGHFLAGDFADLSRQLRAGVAPDSVVSEPFFENQVFPGSTQVLADFFRTLITRGDLGDVVQGLDNFGLLAPGIGLPPQWATDAYITNKSFSTYNGLLTSLHKRLSYGLQFDVSYTYSHSIDNGSATANNIFGTGNFAGGLICDVTNLNVCRGDSDFDIRHVITANGIWSLPIGRGRRLGGSMPGWLDQVVGGWQLSGVEVWHTGFAFTTVSNAFPLSFFNNVPAIFDGDRSAVATNVHTDPVTGTVQLFRDPSAAMDAFSGPLGLQAGSRNNLRGPHFSNTDLGLAKHFRIGERLVAEFRADAYNVFNHVNFDMPGPAGSKGTADITDPSGFGVITGADASRQMQFALRLDF